MIFVTSLRREFTNQSCVKRRKEKIKPKVEDFLSIATKFQLISAIISVCINLGGGAKCLVLFQTEILLKFSVIPSDLK